MKAKTLMIGGTMSSAGKSMIAAGLCRLYARRGVNVVPFKAQNMSNNAAVCPSGGEIGRAQAVQAFAAGVEPNVLMNPVLLKPEGDRKSQVILSGKACGSLTGTEYYAKKEMLWKPITESLNALRESADLVIIEGAGSIAELNLQKSDVTNMAVARYAGAPCLLVGDIDCGGVFAQLAGTWWLLDETDRRHLKAFIVNKFRGDPALFADGLRLLTERSGGVPVAGLVPFLPNHGIPDEDAASFSPVVKKNPDAKLLCVVKLPFISNFDDFDPLKLEPGVEVRFTDDPKTLEKADAIFLPGTKNTISDMLWLRESGMADAILFRHLNGAPVVGICGGYQLMGERIDNPDHVETDVSSCPGLGLLPVTTTMAREKKVTWREMEVNSIEGFLDDVAFKPVRGYEIHNGETVSPSPIFMSYDGTKPLPTAMDGAIGKDGMSFGTYLHGIFENDDFRAAWLKRLGVTAEPRPYREKLFESVNRLATHLETSLNMDLIDAIIEAGVR